MHRPHCLFLFFVFALAAGTIPSAAQDKVYQTGASEPASGTIVKVDDVNIHITLGQIGTTTIPRQRVERVEVPIPPPFNQALQAFEKNQFSEVAQALEPLYTKYKGLPQDWLEECAVRLGESYAELKEWGKAREVFNAIHKFYPQSRFKDEMAGVEAQIMLGLKQPDQARALLEPLIKNLEEEISKSKEGALGEDDAKTLGRAYLVMGQCLLSSNQPKEALEAFLRTILIFHADANAAANALYQSALVYEQTKNPAQAKGQLEVLLKEYPAAPVASEARKKLETLKVSNPSEGTTP
ncbi:MAG: tetratricopeptide repeat protein [Verrucomicrobiae bacterium]|nr:tetratricopeptide repeat protein [Verrucomicrobiae bacterium]